MRNLYRTIHSDKRVVVINMTYWFSNTILRMSEILQHNFFVQDIMIFQMCKYEFKSSLEDSKSPSNESVKKFSDIQNTLISNDILPTEGLTKKLENLTNEQWLSLIEIIKSIHEYVGLLNFVPQVGYDDYSVVIGPTSITDDYSDGVETMKRFRDIISNASEWWDAPELKATIKQSWAKTPVYVLSFTAGILSVVYSLAVLTKYIAFHRSDD
ncbi:hypothetical protein G210_5153, partial [Candida maltosa Xu316]